MKPLPTLAWAALLGLVLLPPCLVFAGVLELGAAQNAMLAGTVVWFGVAAARALRG